jgi:hypothetical protein
MLGAMSKKFLAFIIVIAVSTAAWAQQAPIEYTLSFPAPEHRWMQVEVRFSNVPAGTLRARRPDATRCTSSQKTSSTCRS